MFESEGKYPTGDEFNEWLKTGKFSELVEQWLFNGDIFAFDEKPDAAGLLISHLSSKIGTQAQNIRVVGSAKVGFSLSPDSFRRSFGEDSDIDVMVVDADLFDMVWHSILRWDYPRRQEHRIAADREFCKVRAREIYCGWGQT